MRRIAIALLLALSLASGLVAQSFTTESTITVSNTAVAITTSTSHTVALCTVETAQLRFYVSGSTPTASAGHLREVGDVIQITGNANIRNFKAIRVSSTDSKLVCSFAH